MWYNLKTNLKGLLMIMISILFVIIAFVADSAHITVSDIFVMFYWIFVLILLLVSRLLFNKLWASPHIFIGILIFSYL